MSIILDFRMQTPIMKDARAAAPDMKYEVLEERIDDSGVAKIVFAASGGKYSRLEAAMEDDPSISETRPLSNAGEEPRLYRVTLTPAGKQGMVYPFAVEYDVIFQSMRLSTDSTEIRANFPNREVIQEFQSYCDEHDLEFRFVRIFREEKFRNQTNPTIDQLSSAQEEALLLALQSGYFDIPRRTDFDELSEAFGISNQAVSQRIRRGLKAVLEATMYPLVERPRP